MLVSIHAASFIQLISSIHEVAELTSSTLPVLLIVNYHRSGAGHQIAIIREISTFTIQSRTNAVLQCLCNVRISAELYGRVLLERQRAFVYESMRVLQYYNKSRRP